MWWLLAGLAYGWDDPNRAVTVHVAVVHALKQEHPWGVRIGADWQLALGDHCTYGPWEAGDCRGTGVYPIAGPAGAITWRGGPRFGFEVDGEVGVGGLEMAHFHFLPMWEVIGRVGLCFEVDGLAVGLVLGGFATKSFGVTVHIDENTTTTYGAHGIGARFDADTFWVFGDGWRMPTLAGGLWLAPQGGYWLD